MIRKMLVIAAAIAMPVSVIAVSGVTAGAASKPPPDPAITCAVTATVTFASPGISKAGSASTAKTSATTTSGESFSTKGSDGACSGTAPGNTITTKSVKCTGVGTPTSNTACPGKKPTMYGYGSWSNFETEGTTSIQKALKTISFTINGIAYTSKTSSAADIGCAGGEVGFSVTGAISAPKQDKGQSSVLDACLGAVTGTGLASPETFANQINGTGTVKTATLDPATSTVAIDGGS
jgi:hypothetical protein